METQSRYSRHSDPPPLAACYLSPTQNTFPAFALPMMAFLHSFPTQLNHADKTLLLHGPYPTVAHLNDISRPDFVKGS